MRLVILFAVAGLIILMLSAKGCDTFAKVPSLGPQNVVSSGGAMVNALVDFGKRFGENATHNLNGTSPEPEEVKPLPRAAGEQVLVRYLPNRSGERVTYTFGSYTKTLEPGEELPIQITRDANGNYPVVRIEAHLLTSNQRGILTYYPESGKMVIKPL